MKTDEAVYLLRRLGLTLEVDAGRLIVTPANLIDDDTRWLIRKHRDAIIAELADVPRWNWLVRFDGYALETYHHPDATHAAILERYPDALAAEPIPERITPAEADAVAWPTLKTTDDERRTCDQCANLVRRRCLAAWRCEIVANRDYEPVRDILRRCEGYAPGADDPDTRPGRERWPELIRNREANYD